MRADYSQRIMVVYDVGAHRILSLSSLSLDTSTGWTRFVLLDMYLFQHWPCIRDVNEIIRSIAERSPICTVQLHIIAHKHTKTHTSRRSISDYDAISNNTITPTNNLNWTTLTRMHRTHMNNTAEYISIFELMIWRPFSSVAMQALYPLTLSSRRLAVCVFACVSPIRYDNVHISRFHDNLPRISPASLYVISPVSQPNPQYTWILWLYIENTWQIFIYTIVYTIDIHSQTHTHTNTNNLKHTTRILSDPQQHEMRIECRAHHYKTCTIFNLVFRFWFGLVCVCGVNAIVCRDV